MGEPVIKVNIILDNKQILVPYSSNTTAEDVCIYICKQLNISPLTRHLFALRISGKNVFLMPAATFSDKPIILDFRIRFKVANISKLRKLDMNAYNYYFHQARNDVLENKIPDIIYEKYRQELMGLGISDMYRVMLEKDIPRESVENDYKKYIPKEVLKRHPFFIKKPIHDTLGKLQKSVHDAWYVKAEYIRQLEIIAPEYLSEVYKAVIDQDGTICNISIKVSPHHPTEPGIKYLVESKTDQWQLICTIEELGFISIRNDGTTEISRKNGIPFYLKFNSMELMYSFISLLDGYYRLTCKWTFNICREVFTPSLQKLHAMKCHGPVGGEFSYSKLESKRNSRAGCFIIRESESKYNDYYIDVCMKEGLKPKTFKLEKISGDKFIFNDDLTKYKSIHQLMSVYNDPNEAIYLQECLPPSEYDIPPLLLCRSELLVGNSLTDSSAVNILIPSSPMCINCKSLQVYKDTPVGNLTDLADCKVSHLGIEYRGQLAKTISRVRCQSWSIDTPHKVNQSIRDWQFPDNSIKKSKNYCRNPTRDTMGPWCYSMNYDLEFEGCGIPLCSFSQCKVTGPGMEYGGLLAKAASGRTCRKWDKDRNKVRQNGNITSVPKFKKELFPENSLTKAKKYCRNPDGDVGGPWCFVEDENLNEMEKEYCDIPFCDDPMCLFFTRNDFRYTHFTHFPSTISNLTFGIKLWDSDSFLEGSARLILSVMALPLTGIEIEQAGIGLELLISNNKSALRYGNKDKPEYEETHGIFKSTEFTKFTISWHAGFITLALEGETKPIFLAEYKIKNNLLGFKKNTFLHYSAQGTNVLWHFPFCNDAFECPVHTTMSKNFQQFLPLREKEQGHDIYLHVRAFHSAIIAFFTTPTVTYPFVKFMLSDINNNTKITTVKYKGGPELVLKEMQIGSFLNYWDWKEFSISFFADRMHIYVKKPLGMQILFNLKDEVFRKLRWYSVSSANSIAQWSFYCTPPHSADPPMAVLPECTLTNQEQNYVGTQDVTSAGLPCLPWSAKKLINVDARTWFKNSSVFQAWNYCRDPLAEGGAYCYAISLEPQEKIAKTHCYVRKCRSAFCRMAGTGNDFIGPVSITRSNRKCDTWDFSGSSPNTVHKNIWNGTLFPDQSSKAAKNFCRNPNRNISGSWCYTTDVDTIEDSCNVRDCDKAEECIIIVETTALIDRRIYILPQWKERGYHGGLRFSVKEWDPDLLDGLDIMILPKVGSDSLLLQIGAEMNEKVKLIRNGNVVLKKTMPHMVLAGSWNDLWLQMRKGEIMLGFEGVPTAFFEWTSKNMDQEFEPFYMRYGSMFGKPIGVYFKCNECHTENVTEFFFGRTFPIGMWQEEKPIFNNFTLNLRGVGIAAINLMWIPGNFSFYSIRIDATKGTVYLSKLLNKKIIFQSIQNAKNLFLPNAWTKYQFFLNENNCNITRNGTTVFYLEDPRFLPVYWFSICPETGWLTWSVNCDTLDIDGPPRDGGWGPWSSWTCTVSCGGGEGFRTRNCSNPRPNILGRNCEGSPTSKGKCNDFPCGDISELVLKKVMSNLKHKSFSYIIEEGESLLLENDKELLTAISKESPDAYYEWTLNGIFIKADFAHITFPGDNLLIKHAKKEYSGIYVCMLFRINNQRVILKVISLAVKSKRYDYDTRATRDLVITCNAVILGRKKEGLRGITVVFRSMWIITKGKKIECAIKMLKQGDSEKYSKDFLTLAGQWAFLQSSSIVRLYGITLTSNISLVSEYIRLGSLDQYLRKNQGIIKTVDLIEAASNLASALWHLTENGIVHGRIRCRKLLVNTHDENSFTVKLADPGVHTEYTASEIHWIPVECYSRLDGAKRSTEADVWAFGTTLWEIFMYGKEIIATDQDMTFYINGMRLPQPQTCSYEIYALMKECWDIDPHKRKKPQAIMRDINQILYQVYNSRRTHSYAKVFNKSNGLQNTGTSTNSLCSYNTESTIIGHSDDLATASDLSSDFSEGSNPTQTWLRCYKEFNDENEGSYSHYMSNLFSNHLSTATTSLDSLNSMQSVFELDGSCNVVLQGRIGQGFYGEVYRGTLEYIDGQEKEPRKVAVKKLKATALSSCLQDFEREITIMKALNHPNIVEILGVLREPEISLVMEFVHHGSLLSYLNYKDNLEESQLLKYALDIAKGMDYLGTKNIVHRDLAARNILVVNEDHVKISDFGLAQVMEANDYYILKTPNRELPIKWYAPESLRDGKFSTRSDVWSYGVTMCETFNYGEEPNLTNVEKGIEGQQQQILLQALERGARFPCPPNCPKAVYIRIIYPCWKANPHERPAFSNLISEINDLLHQY